MQNTAKYTGSVFSVEDVCLYGKICNTYFNYSNEFIFVNHFKSAAFSGLVLGPTFRGGGTTFFYCITSVEITHAVLNNLLGICK